MFEVFYKYFILHLDWENVCYMHVYWPSGFFVHCCGVLSHMLCCIGRQKVYMHWCGCYIRVLQISCMVVMFLVVIWASCDWITSHVLGILLLGLSSYNLVCVHFHDSVRSSCSSSNSISQSVLLICSFGSSGSCHQGGATMTHSFLNVSVGPSPSHY